MSAVSLHQILTHLTWTNPQATLQHFCSEVSCSFDSFAILFGVCWLWSRGRELYDTQNLHPKLQLAEIRLHGSIIVPSLHRKSGAVTMSLFKFATSKSAWNSAAFFRYQICRRGPMPVSGASMDTSPFWLCLQFLEWWRSLITILNYWKGISSIA